MFYEGISADKMICFTLYGVTATVALIATVYLLCRRGNAFAPGVTPPLRLRRWTAAFFAAATLSHAWWFFFYLFSCAILSTAHIAIAVIDSMTLMITIAGTLLAMLQDRRRPVWPVVVAMIPIVLLGAVLIVSPSAFLMSVLIGCFLTVCLLFTLYMVVAVRQYNRWLCDNFADLENKRVWLSQLLVVAVCLLFVFYTNDDGNPIKFTVMTACDLLLFPLLLWRVETLPQLTVAPLAEQTDPPGQQEQPGLETLPVSDIQLQPVERLLAAHCVATKLYLQHELTLAQLAKALGSNRTYLSHYFSSKGTTYNAYINDLRIDHFVSRYREALANGQTVTAQQLANESGYRSYSTFSLAFKQRMGQSVTAWMRSVAP